MPISICCGECGRDYRVKDEAAGKKMKCKDCGAVISVPSARSGSSAGGGKSSSGKKPTSKKSSEKDPWDEDDPYADLDLSGQDDLPPDENDEDDETAARPVSKPKKKSKRKSSSGSDGLLKKIGGGIGTLFVILIVVGKILKIVGVGGLGGGASWREFSPPGGEFKVQMPSNPTSSTKLDGGVTSNIYESKTSRMLCGVEFARAPIPIDGLLVREAGFAGYIGAIQAAKPGLRITGQRDFQFRGFPCREWQLEYETVKNVSRAYLMGNQIFALQFIGAKTSFDQNSMNTFFDSFDPVVGRAGGAPGAMPGMNAPAGMPIPGAMPPGVAPGVPVPAPAGT